MRDDNFGSVQQNQRVRARWITGFAAISVAAGVVVACVELKGQLGSDCLKNEDCQSGVCAQLHCAEPAPEFLYEAGIEAGADATPDGAPIPPTDGPVLTMEASGDGSVLPDGTMVEPDGGPPPPPDATMDVIEETPGPDAPPDSPPDAPTDAKGDAENG